MLRRADNVKITFVRRPLSQWGYVTVSVGKDTYRTGWGSRGEFTKAVAVQHERPQFVICHQGRNYWEYRGRYWWDNDSLTGPQVHAMISSREDRQRAQVQRAETIFAMGGLSPDRPRQRPEIPDDVKHLVMLRDQGRCRQCGTNAELQFDHIIPFAMGGGSAPDNLQILCGPCNRRKGARVSVS